MSYVQDLPEASSADAEETDSDRHDPRLPAENDQVWAGCECLTGVQGRAKLMELS